MNLLRCIWSPKGLSRCCLLGALFIVWSSKLALIDYMGSDVPFADQWTAEGSTLMQVKIRDGSVHYGHFLFPHSEHRPALTRIWAYGLFLLGGETWDARVQMVANLAIHAVILGLYWTVAATMLQGGRLVLSRAAAVVVCALPAHHENFVWGFQSQFLFFIACGFGHVWGSVRSRRVRGGWVVAQLAGLAGIFSIAGGITSAMALVSISIIEALRGRRDLWVWATLAVNIGLAGYGLWLLPKLGGGAEASLAWENLVHSFSMLLAWPLVNPWWAIVTQLPVVAALVWMLRQREDSASSRTLFGLVAWIWLFCAALAYGRGREEMSVAVRYFDVLIIAGWLNLTAWLWLESRLRGKLRWALVVFGAGLIPTFTGVAWINRPAATVSTVVGLGERKTNRDAAVREFMKTDDPAVLERDAEVRRSFPHFPYTVGLLRDPAMRRVWPTSLREDGEAHWLSSAALAVVESWRLMMGVGLLVLVTAAGGALQLRRKQRSLPSSR